MSNVWRPTMSLRVSLVLLVGGIAFLLLGSTLGFSAGAVLIATALLNMVGLRVWPTMATK